jgi:hypothetical protein
MNLRFAALALVLFPAIAAAAPRDLVSSGRVFGPGGDALDGPHTVTFRLLDSVGAEQWTTTQSVDFDDGYYAARLTNVDPVAFTKDLTLAVGIGGVEVGRHPLAATPYALAVDGVVRVSAAPTSCTPALAGTLRYNTGTLEVCNGAAYAPLVTGSPSGSVVDYRHTQVVGGRNLTGTFPWDDTIPQNNEGSELVSVTITPKSASNLLVFEGIVNWSEPTNHSNYLTVALFKDGTANAFASSADAASNGNGRCTANSTYPQICATPFRYTTTAGSTTSQTWRLRVGLDGGNVYINQGFNGRNLGGSVVSGLSVTEVVP